MFKLFWGPTFSSFPSWYEKTPPGVYSGYLKSHPPLGQFLPVPTSLQRWHQLQRQGWEGTRAHSLFLGFFFPGTRQQVPESRVRCASCLLGLAGLLTEERQGTPQSVMLWALFTGDHTVLVFLLSSRCLHGHGRFPDVFPRCLMASLIAFSTPRAPSCQM